MDQAIYASLVYRCPAGDCVETDDPIFYVSQDYGKNWNPETNLPEDIEFNDNPTECDVEENICYRINGEAEIQISKNKGNSWKRDWIFPSWRLDYMERWPTSQRGFFPEGKVYDVEVLGNGDQHYVIVALGNQGVIVNSPDGDWERYAIGLSRTTPFRATNFSQASDSISLPELAYAMLASFLVFLIFTFSAWFSLLPTDFRGFFKSVMLSALPSVTAIALYYLYTNYYDTLPFHQRDSQRVIRELLYLLPVIGFLLTWLPLILNLPNKRSGLQTLAVTMATPIIFFISVLIPYYLWAFGIIPVHWAANILAFTAGLTTLIYGFRLLSRSASQATTKPAVSDVSIT